MSTASSTRLDPDRYLAAVAADAARFVDVLATVPDGTRVPTCADWNVEDLLHHLGQVHHFWALVITTGVRDDAEAEALGVRIREGCRDLPTPRLEDFWGLTYAHLPDALVNQREDYLAYEASFEEA